MGLKNTIDKLFDDDLLGRENLPGQPTELAEITPKTLEDVLKNEDEEPARHDGGGIEQRRFHRADVQHHELELKFHNQTQFAKQYIENISMGGLFVRTEQKFKYGEILPINFSIPGLNGSEAKDFSLHGKVCRIRDEGVGLEFTNLTDEIRQDLEAFIQQSLPDGIGIQTKAKQSTLDRLREMRERKEAQALKTRKRSLQVASVVILLALNSVLMFEQMKDPVANSEFKEQKITIGDKEIYTSNIKNLSKNKSGEVQINLQNDEAISIPAGEANQVLPYHMRHSYQMLKKIKPKKRKRMSRNAHRHSRLR